MIWVFSLKGSPATGSSRSAAPKPPENVVGFSGPIAKANESRSTTTPMVRFARVCGGNQVSSPTTARSRINATSVGWRRLGHRDVGERRIATVNVQSARYLHLYLHAASIHDRAVIVTGQAVASASVTVVEPAAKPAGAAPATTARTEAACGMR